MQTARRGFSAVLVSVMACAVVGVAALGWLGHIDSAAPDSRAASIAASASLDSPSTPASKVPAAASQMAQASSASGLSATEKQSRKEERKTGVPAGEPDPDAVPDPTPDPVPDPTPDPTPDPAPDPEPEPGAAPDPAPDPAPEPDPVPVAPGTPTSVTCAAGDMVDLITFSAPSAGGPVDEYALYRSATLEGGYSLVTTAGPEATSVSVPVIETGTWFYRVSAHGEGGSGEASDPVVNSMVAITASVPPGGAVIRASNGEMSLVLPAGAFAEETVVRVTEVSGSPVGGLIRLAGVYEITPSGVLGAPATLSVAYTVAVEHFQVADAIVRSAALMTFDPEGGEWVPGATGITADGTYLTGTLTHFSYWTGATVQPHGTSTTTYCSSGSICHDLASYPGSATRIAARDSQVCYNCHGNDDPDFPPAGTDPDEPNIQAELFQIPGYGAPDGASAHPVATGDLYCTVCHDPHADPAASPGLLKAWNPLTGTYLQGGGGSAPGTEFCWTCHGAIRNKFTNYYVTDYFTNSGGDKKTGFNGAHTALGQSTWRYDSPEEFARGYMDSLADDGGGTLGLSGLIVLPKGLTVVSCIPLPGYNIAFPDDPAKVYDAQTSTYANWHGKYMGAGGASPSTPEDGQASITLDLGAQTPISSLEFYMYNVSGFPTGTWSADRVTILVSDDNVDWRPLASLGDLGTRLDDYFTIEGTDSARYVFIALERRFDNPDNSIGVAEINIYGPATQGTFEIRPDIARNTTYSGGTLKWLADDDPESTSVLVTARASTDRGATWTSWQPMTNGGAISQIPTGASLANARLQVRAFFDGAEGASPTLQWIEVDMLRGTIPGAVPQWSGSSPTNLCRRCHTSHGSESPGLVDSATSTASCKTCHAAALGSSYTGAAQFAASAHAPVPCADCHTAHGKSNSSGTTYAFLLKNGRPESCLDCHDGSRAGAADVKSGFDAKQGTASEWAKHDVFSSEQVRSTSSIACRNCHGTHFSSTGLVNPDSPTTAFTALRDDPTSIPTGEVVIVASKDTMIESTAGRQTWNYGASTQFTITPSTRMLVYFDLSAIPAGATIQNAELVLWGTSGVLSTYKGGFNIYPLSRPWSEGTGTGTVNNSSSNGATWYETRYGDNANTGNTAGGDWATSGAAGASDYAATPTATSSGVNAVNITTLVQAQRAGTNNGLLLVASDTVTGNLPVYTRENAVNAQYRPHLRVTYQTGPATRQVIDDITFCTKCHDGSMPLGLTGQSLSAVANMYAFGAHGGAKGKGPESAAFSSLGTDRGGGYLKAPYSYGMDPLPCTTCHDPHGSKLPYHLREVINGETVVPSYGDDWGYDLATEGSGLGYFCAACHVFPSDHSAYETSLSNCSTGCHNHAGK